ncbi:OmpA family protein [Burkholderia sp. 9775_39]|uniref:OmpA family protein n=1 Tax=unclassified Burkholderia TaxID=2613784 RepID=UPI0018C3C0D2|nr:MULTISPECIES: OmpA family protein [unclassified Burkholderia]MBG0881273.1 OmpA family protein [Burkholderia sp. 9775_39]MBG0887650.1 OmpA family protein [Burkholderia sp. 9773_38]
MKSDLPALHAGSTLTSDRGHEGLGYPSRLMAAFAAVLTFTVMWLVLPISSSIAWTLSTIVGVATLVMIGWRTHSLARARGESVAMLAALGAETADIPVKLRTRMPLVLVTGDGLPALFDRSGETRHAHVGDGGIWLRVDRPQDLPRLAGAVKQWRDGRAPDGIVLSVAPALHAEPDVLSQKLRAARQAVSDAARMLGTRLPGYVAIYQRLTPAPCRLSAPAWYGASSAAHLDNGKSFEPVIRTAEDEIQHAADACVAATRAAALASVIGWTQRVVFSALTDRQQPATPWTLFGVGWIDCGPASTPGSPWERDIEMQTRVMRAGSAASPAPWPLPQPLIEAMPRRYWISPRLAAVAHVLTLLACAAGSASWGAARNNETLLNGIGADLGRYSTIPADHYTAKQDAFQTLVADRDQLDRYARTGIPLRLSFGMYRGTQLIPALNEAIASYVPPAPPPAVVTLDSMSLFDSGKAQLKPGTNRSMVGVLDMIKAHPDKRILVAGYTDDTGTPDGNLKLSTARAQAVRDWLVDASGIPATQFAIQGYGMTRPIATNDTPGGRARNRRVEITLVPDTGM